MRYQNGKQDPLRVVIADDIMATLHSALLMFSLIDGVEVIEIANSGRQALEIVKKHSPDIVLMDVNMPELGGLAAAKAMLEHDSNLACIIMSSEGDPQTRQAARAVGAKTFLLKPFTTDQLLEAVQPLIQMLRTKKENARPTQPPPHQRQVDLEKLANEYARTRRSDEKALAVFETLASEPNCELRWLKTLAMIYVIHMKWGKLKNLADRLEKYHQVNIGLIAPVPTI